MRIALDTNVLLSVIAFRSKKLAAMLSSICERHQLILSSYVVDECYEVIERKQPRLIPALDQFFAALPFELVHSPAILPKHDLFTIRDSDDEMVLYSAILADADILITGDKDFQSIELEKPEIMTPGQFIEQHLSQ